VLVQVGVELVPERVPGLLGAGEQVAVLPAVEVEQGVGGEGVGRRVGLRLGHAPQGIS
jgi:hypothetical protein